MGCSKYAILFLTILVKNSNDFNQIKFSFHRFRGDKTKNKLGNILSKVNEVAWKSKAIERG